jgi:CDP-diacylglycerol--glycerol-3-phosphate 3-phosphatidyltransferase
MLDFKKFNFVDWISFYRILAAPLLLSLLWLDKREVFTWFLLISYFTDMIDGFLARKFKISSARGSQLDSFGDQVTFSIGLIALFIFEKEFIIQNLILILIAFIPYVIQMIIAYSKYGKTTAFHTYLAKISAIIQGTFILWSLFFMPNYWLFYSIIVFGILETTEEIILIFMHEEWISDIKGIYWALRDKRILKKKNKTM